MTNDQIEKFLSNQELGENPVQITFKTRRPIAGLFIKMDDFSELKSKNLWRIVAESSIEAYKNTRDTNLARIFNGTEFTKLGLIKAALSK